MSAIQYMSVSGFDPGDDDRDDLLKSAIKLMENGASITNGDGVWDTEGERRDFAVQIDGGGADIADWLTRTEEGLGELGLELEVQS